MKAEQKLVDKFNSTWKIGDRLNFKKSTFDEPQEVTVRHEAYISASGMAVVFFNEIRGFCSIHPNFVIYP